MSLLWAGVGWTDGALTLNRMAVGAFFMLSGYRKLFNAERHRAMVNELKALGVPAVGFNQWWVPSVEFAAGGAVLIGLLASIGALGLLVITVVAVATSGRQRIELYKPIDEVDRIDDWLYLPETLYAIMLLVVASAGSGAYSFDALILNSMNKHCAAITSQTVREGWQNEMWDGAERNMQTTISQVAWETRGKRGGRFFRRPYPQGIEPALTPTPKAT